MAVRRETKHLSTRVLCVAGLPVRGQLDNDTLDTAFQVSGSLLTSSCQR